MTDITIRNEEAGDFREVEHLVRESFWNVNVPGCCEHYLAHVLRSHADFVPELDLVAQTADGTLIANVMYTKSRLSGDDGTELSVLTFGPLSVRPGFQRQGIGRRLLEETFGRVRAMGFAAVVIFGSPGNYVSRGFKSCRKYRVRTPDGRFPCALLVKELFDGALARGTQWTFHESPAYSIDSAAAAEFDAQFPPLKAEFRASQEEFYILSRSEVR